MFKYLMFYETNEYQKIFEIIKTKTLKKKNEMFALYFNQKSLNLL